MLAVSQLAGRRLRPARHASSSYLTEPDDVLAGSQSIKSLAWGNRELFFFVGGLYLGRTRTILVFYE